MSTAGPLSNSYFMTITLSRDLLQLPAKKQLQITYNKLNDLFMAHCNDYSSGCFEFTKTGNIHYHYRIVDNDDALIMFSDSLKHLKYKGNFMFGFTKTDLIKTDNGVLLYIRKDSEKTRAIMRKMGIFDPVSKELLYDPDIVYRDDYKKHVKKVQKLNALIIRSDINGIILEELDDLDFMLPNKPLTFRQNKNISL